jgi:serine/alanine adding enzyme
MIELLLTVEDDDQWRSYLPADLNVFGSVAYARINQQYNHYEPRLYVLEQQNGARVVYPFFLRTVNDTPFFDGPGTLWDTVTPEFTGPLSVGEELVDALDFAARFDAVCRATGIVAEFAHLSPWQAAVSVLETENITFDRKIVYVDLTHSRENLWDSSLSYACQKNIRKARRANVRVFPATTLNEIVEFHRVYTATMERNNASPRYFFSLDYFVAFFEGMPDHARFMLAEYDRRIVAGTLYLHDRAHVYSYLGGALYDYQDVRPNNLIIFETILWAMEAHKKRLILGGGYTPGDGIYRFKKSFSPLTARFHVYKKIHIPETYEMLCNRWKEYHNGEAMSESYFPRYRSVPRDGASASSS